MNDLRLVFAYSPEYPEEGSDVRLVTRSARAPHGWKYLPVTAGDVRLLQGEIAKLRTALTEIAATATQGDTSDFLYPALQQCEFLARTALGQKHGLREAV